jgi:hypothetical protein
MNKCHFGLHPKKEKKNLKDTYIVAMRLLVEIRNNGWMRALY